MKTAPTRTFYAQYQRHKHSYSFFQKKRPVKISTSYSLIIHRLIHNFYAYAPLFRRTENFSVFLKIYHVDCKLILLIVIKLRFLTKK